MVVFEIWFYPLVTDMISLARTSLVRDITSVTRG